MPTQSFKNHFLIAMPNLKDPYFQQTVILLFEHSEQGAMGLIINKPLDISIEEILQHLAIPSSNSDLEKIKSC
jgi:putative transcriptional regulator